MGATTEPGTDERADVFAALWDAHAARVQAYARRRVGPDLAEEVVAETFLVAWRRLDRVAPDPLPWLLVVARNTIANQRRATGRRDALTVELAGFAAVVTTTAAPDVGVVERQALLRALAALSAAEREALLLVGWDGLEAADAAAVAGCSVSAFRMRLSRARRRLAAAADEVPEPTGHPHSTGLAPARPSATPEVVTVHELFGDRP
jgi:RNA polymerase sigma-70 factor (ECF subfamily)